jgi:hypothetical protein
VPPWEFFGIPNRVFDDHEGKYNDPARPDVSHSVLGNEFPGELRMTIHPDAGVTLNGFGE